MACTCNHSFSVRLCRSNDYADFKKVLDIGKHPAFIGRNMFERNSNNGGGFLYIFNAETVAASLVNPHYGILLALNVIPAHRDHGLGRAIVAFLAPNFVRVVENKVPFFKALGYVPCGAIKSGITMNTQIMVRENLIGLAGRLSSVWNHG